MATEGNLVKVIQPKFVSLVGSPANQTPIRIVRSAPPKGVPMSASTARRIRRSTGEVNPVLQLSFPDEMTDTEIAATLTVYGMNDYKVERKDGKVYATRSDLQSIARSDKTMDVKLTDKITALVQRSDASMVGATVGQPGISVVAFEFSAEKFADVGEVAKWIERNSVDKASAPTQNPDLSCFEVKRGQMEEGADTRRIELEDGVVATIVRSDDGSIPAGMVAVVSEAAYGGYGWGQLDFAAALADTQFCEWMDEGIRRLRYVLENILFYSQLPLDVRKTLVSNALAQFDAFVAGIMDSMPRQLLISVTRSAQPKEIPMSTSQTQGQGGAATPAASTTTTGTEVQRAAPAAAAATPAANGDEKITLTRSELATLVRAELAAKETEDKATAEAAKAAEVKRAEEIEAATAPLKAEIEKLKGTTVVRSGGDPAVAAQQAGATGGEKKDVFRGAFGALPFGGRKPAQAVQ
jgi:hypothetical protein